MKSENEKTEVVNAIIESAKIGMSRGVFLDSWLTLNYGGSVQGFGGYVLGGESTAKAGNHAEQPNLAAEWIVSVMRAAEVENFDDLVGKSVRVERGEGFGGKVIGIGHITKNDRWFRPEQRFKEMMKECES